MRSSERSQHAGLSAVLHIPTAALRLHGQARAREEENTPAGGPNKEAGAGEPGKAEVEGSAGVGYAPSVSPRRSKYRSYVPTWLHKWVALSEVCSQTY